MKTKSFREELQNAKEHSYAVGAFNIFNYLSARAVIRAAQKLDSPVILQTSTQTVRKFGPQELGTMLRQLAWNASVNVIIHLDHCQNVEMAKACMDAGWDSIMFDGSHFPLGDNVRMTKKVIAYARPRKIYVEGELGRIAGVEDDLKVDEKNAMGATLDESLYYVKATGVDAFAPAVGTAHGVYKGTPVINFDLVKVLKEQIDTPVVIHGGTGLSEETFRMLIKNGGAKVNVSTAIKHAYIDGCKEYIQNNPEKLDPIDFDQYLNCKIEDVVMYHMELFRKDMK
ncbi:class II fructose-bisphosphate aldolase [Eubacterium sp. am_0171]|uniref:class II fructose-bisphosphate aldolase n=1 Tax=unclassified Eubacterium (in: firmicutes) TaxID=2624479 RepID=UPI00101F95E3|nr:MULTISPECIES: class II fructose-bisphosphate aldolase [unclassified Eubacterium (in: firmicutes)]MSC83440.1 ketose-bisphosphate aldolase [Eubacterium sp. BIOML-A1]MSD05222.1 ketose-bisphosphate aldolase [Eubacterium sp. BIOML-A2]RYT24883.1 class II fructose-bisphosphate aldolase [Eubacterium sp. am_0171]